MAMGEAPITRSELREELRTLRDEFHKLYATKADLATLEVRLTDKINGGLRWMVVFQLAGLAAIAAIMRFLG